MGNGLESKVRDEVLLQYQRWLGAREFLPRLGQQQMIDKIIDTLTGFEPRLGVLEAGTGTGKTAAYSIATITAGKALDQQVVIATATVALQEQIMYRDLPDIRNTTDMNFSSALVKGRGRYVCLKQLDEKLRHGISELGFSQLAEFDTEQIEICQRLLGDFEEGGWDGDRDTLIGQIDDPVWEGITTDHQGCTNNKCEFFKKCPFFKARGNLESIDVLVVNHDLLLADLSLGGGAVLPEPSDCIYVVDEAHRLPEKAQNHFAVSTRIKSINEWIDTLKQAIHAINETSGMPEGLVGFALTISENATLYLKKEELFRRALDELDYIGHGSNVLIHRFESGKIPANISKITSDCCALLYEIVEAISDVLLLLQNSSIDKSTFDKEDDWASLFGRLETKGLDIIALLNDYSSDPIDLDSIRPAARWVKSYGNDFELVAVPLDSGDLLSDVLWSKCFAAISTSATLSVGGKFDRFLEKIGLSSIQATSISSPFNFRSQAKLVVPKMRTDPRNIQDHSREVSDILPGLLNQYVSALVLFSSWKQMHIVVDGVRELGLRARFKIQGDSAKYELIKSHRKDIDKGETSYLFGLASFAEGLDLPDDYCRHVVIARLPFAVPDDPVGQALAEWITSQGRNAFTEISLPEAALRLVQACGRLIRHENDFGQITLLDRRIITQSYGRILLDSLPNYDLVLEDL